MPVSFWPHVSVYFLLGIKWIHYLFVVWSAEENKNKTKLNKANRSAIVVVF